MPVFQLGPVACFCACNPPGRSKARSSADYDDDEERFDADLTLDDRASLGSSARLGPTISAAAAVQAAEEGIKVGLASPEPIGKANKLEGSGSSLGSESSESTTASTPPTEGAGFFPRGGTLDLQLKLSAPPLGPVGCGGWHAEDDMTPDMRATASRAEEIFRKRERTDLTEFNRDFLTSVTLSNYVEPVVPQHLATALVARARNERIFTGAEPVYIGSSTRIIGWDGAGAAVMAAEPCLMRKSLSYIMPQVQYLGWSALDTNKPGANGFSVIMDYGGGFNPVHFLNPKPVIDLASMVEGQWRRRLNVALLVDMPVSFRGILNTFLMFVKQTTREKIKIVPTMEDAVEELRKMGCDAETLAYTQRYLVERRDRSAKQRFHPLVDYSFFREQLADLNLSEDTEFLTEEHHERLRDAIQEFRIHRWGLPSASAAAHRAAASAAHPARSQQLRQPPRETSPTALGKRRVSFDEEQEEIPSGREEEEVAPLPRPVMSKRSMSRLTEGSHDSAPAPAAQSSTSPAAARPALRTRSGGSGGSGGSFGSNRPAAGRRAAKEAGGCGQGLRLAVRMISDCLRGAVPCCRGKSTYN